MQSLGSLVDFGGDPARFIVRVLVNIFLRVALEEFTFFWRMSGNVHYTFFVPVDVPIWISAYFS